MIYDILDAPLHISILVGKFVIVSHVYRVFPILYMDFKTWDDFVISYMTNFDIIFYMTSLSLY